METNSFKFSALSRLAAFIFMLGAPIGASAETQTTTNKALGGDGVVEGERLYSMDLYVHGLHRRPYFDPNVTVSDAAFDRAQRALPMFEDDIIHLFAQKLAEIRGVDSVFAEKILLTAEMFTWSFAPRALMNVYDEEFTVVIPDEMIVQLALRDGKNIRIDSAFWNGYDDAQIDAANKVALIYHEILYALIRLNEVKASPYVSIRSGYKQSSSDTHNAVAFLFSRSLSADNKRRFYAQMGHFFGVNKHWAAAAEQPLDETKIKLQQSVEILKDGELIASFDFPAADRQPIYDLWMEICADPYYKEGKDLKIYRRGGDVTLNFGSYYNPELYMDFQYIHGSSNAGVMDDYNAYVRIWDPTRSHFHFRSGSSESYYNRESASSLKKRCYEAYKNVLLKD